ncbi:ATP-dependent DNA helicase DinG [Algicola sagamiensis]|uniref:ATP-dependent DNA helicase DinG n=1 Tax=Algicola sagamiensis TaxID=163869 RepID=UPI00036DCB5B|nr:ATP-dependent DNA helicase DinG [Algicola sagamiensis]
MLSDQLKQQIRKIYRHISDSLDGFTPRPSQNQLVAEIAKTLAGDYDKQQRMIVIEAGTGTGKSLAYLLGSIPYALRHNKKVIISTATVALQEQLIHKDLPFFSKHSKLEFEYCLLKGRQRYCCLSKLDALVHQEQLSFSALLTQKVTKGQEAKLHEMHKKLLNGSWAGDRDSWPDPIEDHLWSAIESDKHFCVRGLAAHEDCPFHRAREFVETADVLVINHSLLLADLELGGGKILPPTEDCIFVIDEAHHLPDVTRDFSSAHATVKGAMDWLEKLQKLSNKFCSIFTSNRSAGVTFELHDRIEELKKELKQLYDWLNTNQDQFFHKEKLYRFEHGVLPQWLVRQSENLGTSSGKVFKLQRKLHDALLNEVKEGDVKHTKAEPLLTESGFFLKRLENLSRLWQMMGSPLPKSKAPDARWIETIHEGKDFLVSSSPLEVGYFLADRLWSQCAGAVLCSATMTALNKFDHFRYQAGLEANDGTQYLKVDSPFSYQEKAVLRLPALTIEPTQEQFTDTLIETLPELLKHTGASLVLFASYWQMEAVADALREQHHFSLLVQGEASRSALLTLHKQKCDNNEPSILFGTQSFSEGLDLPGHYLTNLVITKIPFAVPTSPVEQAQAEFIKSKDGNPFLTLTVPEASKKLAQACGRLLRKESDHGIITILDRRLISKAYGKSMLNALPPFKRHIEY